MSAVQGQFQRDGNAASQGDLARGMMLLRASNMNVMRLQLAMERQDRCLVMAAMDDLVGLDRELSSFVASMPVAEPVELHRFASRIDAQKQAVVAERLVLARGKAGPALTPVAQADSVEPAAASTGDYTAYDFETTSGLSWLPKLLIAVFVLSIVAIGLAFGLGLLDPYLP